MKSDDLFAISAELITTAWLKLWFGIASSCESNARQNMLSFRTRIYATHFDDLSATSIELITTAGYDYFMTKHKNI